MNCIYATKFAEIYLVRSKGGLKGVSYARFRVKSTFKCLTLGLTEALTLYKSTNVSLQTANSMKPLKQLHLHTQPNVQDQTETPISTNEQ